MDICFIVNCGFAVECLLILYYFAGEYTYQFVTAGTYTYWSRNVDYTEATPSIALYGQVNAVERLDSTTAFTLSIGQQEAVYLGKSIHINCLHYILANKRLCIWVRVYI